MGQVLHFQRQLESIKQRIQRLDQQLIPYETKFCPTCESIDIKTLTHWEQKNIRERRAQRYQDLRELHQQDKAQGMTHKIWQTVGGPNVRESHRAANTQKVTIDEMFTIGQARLFLPSDPSASLNETANCRCDVKYVRESGPRSNAAPQSTPKPRRRPFTTQPRITIPTIIRRQFLQIVLQFHKKTGKTLIVSSGYRPPLRQARAMFNNRRRRGVPFNRVYEQQEPALELEKIYLQGTEKGLSANQIINQIADAIRNQVSQDIFISDHLKERALDISFQGLTPREKLMFEEIARPKLKDLLVEDDHFHLEFR